MTIEDKVNNTLKWLANQIACIQVFHWDEEFKRKTLDDAWQRVQEQFKKDIDWTTLTESQCKALHFKRWHSEEDVEKEITCLQSELDNGHITKEEFEKKVANQRKTIGLYLIPLYLYPSLPIGIILTSIDGKEIVFNGANIDTDIRFGCIAYGIKPKRINGSSLVEDDVTSITDEKKQIVDLKPKWTPKPFDRVITRTPDTPWTANFFSHIDSDGIKNCIDDRYLMCLPYNEETAKLIGTTNNMDD